MTERDTPWPVGTPCWVDMMTNDLQEGRVFYESLFGWHLLDGGPEAGGYLTAHVDGRPVAGLGELPPEQQAGEPAWVTYLATDDAEATVSAIAAAGGSVYVEPFDVLDAGVLALAADPTGGVFGLWQAGTLPGIQLANVASAPIWNELMTRGYAAARDFYAEVFGYSYSDVPAEEFLYSTIEVAGRTVGGVGALPADVAPDVPSHWRAYFGVDDTDAAVDTVVRLGGAVLAPPADSPYGRTADVLDPQGARFSIVSAPEPD